MVNVGGVMDLGRRVKRSLPRLSKRINPHTLLNSLTGVLPDGEVESLYKKLDKSTQPDSNLVHPVLLVLKRLQPDDWVIHFVEALRDAEEFELLRSLGAKAFPWDEHWERERQNGARGPPECPAAVSQLAPPSGLYSAVKDPHSPHASLPPVTTSVPVSVPTADPAKHTRQCSGGGGREAADHRSSFHAPSHWPATGETNTSGCPPLRERGITMTDVVDNLKLPRGYPLAPPQQSAHGPAGWGVTPASSTPEADLSRRADRPDPDLVYWNSFAGSPAVNANDPTSTQQDTHGDLTPNITPSLDNNLDSGLASIDIPKVRKDKYTEVNQLIGSSPLQTEHVKHPAHSSSTEEQLQVDADLSVDDVQVDQPEDEITGSASGRRRTRQIRRCTPSSVSAASSDPPPTCCAPGIVINVGRLVVSGQGNHVDFGGEKRAKTVFECQDGVTVERAESTGHRAPGTRARPPSPGETHGTRQGRASGLLQQAESEFAGLQGPGDISPYRQAFRQAGMRDPPPPELSSDLSSAHASYAQHRTEPKVGWQDSQQVGLGDMPRPEQLPYVLDLSRGHVSDATAQHRTGRKVGWQEDARSIHHQTHVQHGAQGSRVD